MIYVASRDKKLWWLRDQGSSGDWVWWVSFSGELQGSPAIGASGALYVAPVSGFLYAYSASP